MPSLSNDSVGCAFTTLFLTLVTLSKVVGISFKLGVTIQLREIEFGKGLKNTCALTTIKYSSGVIVLSPVKSGPTFHMETDPPLNGLIVKSGGGMQRSAAENADLGELPCGNFLMVLKITNNIKMLMEF